MRVSISSVKLLNAVTVTGAGESHKPQKVQRTFHAHGKTSAGVGSAIIKVQVSNVEHPSVDGDWIDMATITLTLGTTKVSDGLVSDAPWLHVRGKVTTLTGTDAETTLLMGA